jgi:hypothetical protein
MTKLSRRFSNLIAENIDNVEVVEDKVIFLPTKHIVRGFFLEKTPGKNEFYMWNIVVPLFCAYMPNMTLNYSDRFSLDDDRIEEKINISENADGLVDLVFRRLEEKIIPSWKEMFNPEDFLKKFDSRGNCERINIALDLAIAHCLSGNVNLGREKLHEVLAFESESPIAPLIREKAIFFLDALNKNIQLFREMVISIENNNVANHFPGLTWLK